MKLIAHGINHLERVKTVKVPTDTINVEALINTLENNQDKAKDAQFLDMYADVSTIYTELFSKGKLSDETLDKYPHDTLEIACENISNEMDYYFKRPTYTSGTDYYYEYVRSLSVEKQASELKPHLDEESDFI